MADDSLLEPAAIDDLLESNAFTSARDCLQRVAPSDERYAVTRIKLALYEGSMAAAAAMQALIQLMRRDPEWPGAKALYQAASSAAFEERESSHSHSHLPPPVERK